MAMNHSVYWNFIFEDRRRFVFAYVPKVACTNWKVVMRYLAGYRDWLDSRLAHDRKNGGLHYIDPKGPEAEILADTGIPKYTFTRSPYSRCLSAYLNKIEQRLPRMTQDGPGDHFDVIVRAIDDFRRESLDAIEYPNITFEVFLRWLREGKSFQRHDEHWASQTTLLRFGLIQYDFIGRFENMEADAAEVLRRMGADIPFPTQNDVKFAAHGADSRLGEYLTPACRLLINQIYSDDFKNFGYTKIE